MAQRKRILIFAHDGRGLGHLRRLSRIADELQQQASVLVVAGHREVGQLVPKSCEFVHIPSLDSIDWRRSRHWGREPFIERDDVRGKNLRRQLLLTIYKEYAPDGFVSDYLPLGVEHELEPLMELNTGCRNYFIIRGVLGDAQYVNQHVLTPYTLRALRRHYARLLVACDPNIVDVANEYALSDDLVAKLSYAGYVTESFDPEKVRQARANRLLPEGAKWVVCSAGGGKDGEDLLQRSWELAQQFPECYFDLILGPRSRLSALREGWFAGTRIRIEECDMRSLPERLSGADVVICRGGYNSLMEASVGNAQLIVAPIPTDSEQIEHARRLSAYRPLQVIEDIDTLDEALETALSTTPPANAFGRLRINGARHIAQLILSDLRQAMPSPSAQAVG
jgi:predicted glycosyltransferase